MSTVPRRDSSEEKVNAAETRAAQPGDAPKLTADALLAILDSDGDCEERENNLRRALLASRSTPAAPAARPGGEGTQG